MLQKYLGETADCLIDLKVLKDSLKYVAMSITSPNRLHLARPLLLTDLTRDAVPSHHLVTQVWINLHKSDAVDFGV